MARNLTSSASSSTCSPPLDLTKARQNRAQAKVEQQLRMYGAYFDEPKPYLTDRCRVLVMPAKKSGSANK